MKVALDGACGCAAGRCRGSKLAISPTSCAYLARRLVRHSLSIWGHGHEDVDDSVAWGRPGSGSAHQCGAGVGAEARRRRPGNQRVVHRRGDRPRVTRGHTQGQSWPPGGCLLRSRGAAVRGPESRRHRHVPILRVGCDGPPGRRWRAAAGAGGHGDPYARYRTGGTIAQQLTATVTIEAIDAKVPSVTVRSAAGRRSSFRVADAKNLEGYKAGDQVDVTYTRGVAISVK